MNTKKIIGIVLIALGIGAGIMGANTLSENTAAIEIGELEIGASNESGKTTGYIYLGAAVLLFIGGVGLLKK